MKDTVNTGPAVIEAKGLNLVFSTGDGPVHALKDVNLTIGKGEFVSFIGPSGCGKTTLLRAIAALEHPTGGTLSVNGMTPDEARRKRAYGYVFQAAGLYPWRTIAGNVALPLEIMGFSKAEQARAGWRGCWSWSSFLALARNSLAVVGGDAAAGVHCAGVGL